MRGFPSCPDSFLESQLEYDISRMDLDTEKTAKCIIFIQKALVEKIIFTVCIHKK